MLNPGFRLGLGLLFVLRLGTHSKTITLVMSPGRGRIGFALGVVKHLERGNASWERKEEKSGIYSIVFRWPGSKTIPRYHLSGGKPI